MKRGHCPLVLVAAALLALALPSAAGAKARDRNHDRIPDRWEKRHRLSLEVNQARRDQDRDRLRNRAEFLAGTNPRDPDSDGDGIHDDDEHAGRIRSFESSTGMLVISLFGGGSLSGLVTEETDLECGELEDEASASESPGGDEGGEEWEDESGEDEFEDGSECTTADLVPGAVVDEAELWAEDGVDVFEEIELD